MKKSVFLSVLLFFSLSMMLGSAQDAWWEDCKATSLDTNNWNQYVGKDKYVFIEFYASYCIWCKRLVPEFNSLYDMYDKSGSRSDILIAKINGAENREITYAYGISTYPTLLLIEKGSHKLRGMFKSERTAESMSAWIDAMAPYEEPVKAPRETAKPQKTKAEASRKETSRQESSRKEEPRPEESRQAAPREEEPKQKISSQEASRIEFEERNRRVEEELRQQIRNLEDQITEMQRLQEIHKDTIDTMERTIEDQKQKLQAHSTTEGLQTSHKGKSEGGFGVSTIAFSLLLGGIMGAGIGIVFKNINRLHMKE